MFDSIKKFFNKETAVAVGESKPRKKRKPNKSKQEKELTEKEKATLANEPYIKILEIDIDPVNINAGSMTFDWNDKFIINLTKAGYKKKPEDTDNVIVDRWFQTVCRNIALEVYEQEQADPVNRGANDVRPPAVKKNLGDGKVEIS